jgi:hypothetical protein
MRRVLFLAFVLCALPVASHAQLGCYRPDPPSCVRYLTSSSSTWEFDDCRARLTRFQRDVRAYADCVQQDMQQLLDDLDRAIRRFNQCARDRYC